MNLLSFMHLGYHPAIRRLPSLDGLSSLKMLTLAKLTGLEALPSFESLASLQNLVVVLSPLLQGVPDMAPLHNLQAFVSLGRNWFCCNGFWTPCDLNHWMCQRDELWGIPPAACLLPNRTDNTMTSATRAVFGQFMTRSCSDVPIPAVVFDSVTEATARMCDGAMYKRCQLGAVAGMCYNRRLMVVACVFDDQVTSMRQLQIQQGVGDRCDPLHEAWLGCTSK